MRLSDSVDMTDSLGSSIYINFKGRQLFRILPKSNININDQIISDKARFSYDGNHKNRVLDIKVKEKNIAEPKQIRWVDFLKVRDVKKFAKNIHFIVNPDIGLETLYSLKKLSLTRNKVRISCMKSNFDLENLYL